MPDEDHDAHDGCLCDCDHAEHEATEDHDLPAAVGGVQGDPKSSRRKAKSSRRKTDRTSVEEA